MNKKIKKNKDYTEYLTITGNTQTTIFPNLYMDDHTWNNSKIIINSDLISNDTYIESLIITPVTSGGSTGYVDVTLGVGKTEESDAGVETTSTYNIVNDARILTTSSLVFEKEELSIFDPKVFSLFVQASHVSDVITVLFKIKNVKTDRPLSNKNRSNHTQDIINRKREKIIDPVSRTGYTGTDLDKVLT
tara:strand:- start:828 stop:1397 length:570 start_codon:yes stop_codon:yes gene_type:complete